MGIKTLENCIDIRIAQSKDYAEVVRLIRQLNPDDPEPTHLERKTFDEILESTYFHIIAAEKDSRLVGCSYLNIIPNLTRSARPYAVIENVITDGQYRNRGIGQAIMKHALNMAWNANCYKVMLLTGRHDESTHQFYKKSGFSADEKQAYVQRAIL